MWDHPRVDGVRPVLLVQGCLGVGASQVSPRVCWPSPPLAAGMTGIVVTRACNGCWAGPPLSLVAVSCSPVRGGGLLPSCCSRSHETLLPPNACSVRTETVTAAGEPRVVTEPVCHLHSIHGSAQNSPRSCPFLHCVCLNPALGCGVDRLVLGAEALWLQDLRC